ncbi:hypothetical protein HMSSN036_87170 [Paenibacillus macerans]|nr:hypothetical protein HMSSN036_87170 [Paenibacillus macerans]
MKLSVFSSSKLNNKPIFIKYQGEIWFLQHRVEGNVYYLSNKEDITSSTKFKFIDRNELLAQTFQIKDN